MRHFFLKVIFKAVGGVKGEEGARGWGCITAKPIIIDPSCRVSFSKQFFALNSLKKVTNL